MEELIDHVNIWLFLLTMDQTDPQVIGYTVEIQRQGNIFYGHNSKTLKTRAYKLFINCLNWGSNSLLLRAFARAILAARWVLFLSSCVCPSWPR